MKLARYAGQLHGKKYLENSTFITVNLTIKRQAKKILISNIFGHDDHFFMSNELRLNINKRYICAKFQDN